MPLVTKRIEDTNLRIRKGCIGKAFKEIHEYLEPIDAGAAAAIALKLVFDKVFSYKELNTKRNIKVITKGIIIMSYWKHVSLHKYDTSEKGFTQAAYDELVAKGYSKVIEED